MPAPAPSPARAGRSGRAPGASTRVSAGVAAVLLALAVAVRVPLLGHVSPDLRIYLLRWWDHLDRHGLAGLADVPSDYAPPYLHLLHLATLTGVPALVGIKAVSLLGDLALLGAVTVALRARLGTAGAIAGAAAVLLLPPVVLDSAAWGQCDALYAAPLVLAVHRLAHGRPVSAWVLWGLALAVKLQAVFLAPVLLVALLRAPRRTWWLPLLPLVVVLASWVPSLAVGRSLGSLVGIYAGQASSSYLLSFAPNPWYLVQELLGPADAVGLARPALAVAALGALGLVVAGARARVTDAPQRLWPFAAASLLLLPLLLPHMRERYLFPGVVLVAVATLATGRPRWWAPVVLGGLSGLAFADQLWHRQVAPRLPAHVLVLEALPVLLVLVVLLRDALGTPGTARPAPPR